MSICCPLIWICMVVWIAGRFCVRPGLIVAPERSAVEANSAAPAMRGDLIGVSCREVNQGGNCGFRRRRASGGGRSTDDGMRIALAVFGDRARCRCRLLQDFDDPVVAQHFVRALPDRSGRGCGGAPTGRMRIAPSEDWIAEVKKYFSSNTPRGLEMYLFEVTRLTVDLCIEIARRRSSDQRPEMTARRGRRRRPLAHDFGRHLQDRPRPLVEALHQPVGAHQALGHIGLGFALWDRWSGAPHSGC